MARTSIYELDVPVEADGTGAGFPTVDYDDKWVQIGGTFTATVAIQVSINGVDWESLGTWTAPEIVQVLPLCQFVRIVVTGWASGQPTAHLMTKLVRGDG